MLPVIKLLMKLYNKYLRKIPFSDPGPKEPAAAIWAPPQAITSAAGRSRRRKVAQVRHVL
jgi:hypothetical protein